MLKEYSSFFFYAERVNSHLFTIRLYFKQLFISVHYSSVKSFINSKASKKFFSRSLLTSFAGMFV